LKQTGCLEQGGGGRERKGKERGTCDAKKTKLFSYERDLGIKHEKSEGVKGTNSSGEEKRERKREKNTARGGNVELNLQRGDGGVWAGKGLGFDLLGKEKQRNSRTGKEIEQRKEKMGLKYFALRC